MNYFADLNAEEQRAAIRRKLHATAASVANLLEVSGAGQPSKDRLAYWGQMLDRLAELEAMFGLECSFRGDWDEDLVNYANWHEVWDVTSAGQTDNGPPFTVEIIEPA